MWRKKYTRAPVAAQRQLPQRDSLTRITGVWYVLNTFQWLGLEEIILHRLDVFGLMVETIQSER